MVRQFFLVDPILARKLVQPCASAGNDPTGGTSSARLAGTGWTSKTQWCPIVYVSNYIQDPQKSVGCIGPQKLSGRPRAPWCQAFFARVHLLMSLWQMRTLPRLEMFLGKIRSLRSWAFRVGRISTTTSKSWFPARTHLRHVFSQCLYMSLLYCQQTWV